MASESRDNVIAFAPHQARRAIEQRQPRPYLLWYPHVGFVVPNAAVATLSHERIARAPERA